MKTLNDVKEEMAKDLLSKRILYLEGYIDAEKARAFGIASAALSAKDPKKEIMLYIDSSGGKVSQGLSIYDMIVNSEAPVIGVVRREAKSIAAVILQGCKKRIAYKHATIHIHNLTRKEVPLDDVENNGFRKILKEMRGLQNKINRIYARRTGKTLNQIRARSKKDSSMDAAEALKFGLIDKIA